MPGYLRYKADFCPRQLLRMVTGAAASAAAPGMWRAGAFKLSYYGEYLDVF